MKQREKEKLTALFHHLSVDLLREAFYALKRDAAPGVDRLTWEDYQADLELRLIDLHVRLHRGAYRAQPSRRRMIPKPDGRERPLAVAALEDKIVQKATVAVLNVIYEDEFLGFSYGFRPKRGPHDALDALIVGISRRKVNFILDADIRSFFDSVSQSWLARFLEHRIGDRRIIRLIQKWLKAGILEDGIVTSSEMGTGQGSVISPLLANVYLHYVFDLWAERRRRREATGDMIILRIADDIVVGFEQEADARRFWDEMRERFEEFVLSLHPAKTRLLEFGRFAASNRAGRGLGKPETFNFLGFTLICGRSRFGNFVIRRKTRRDRLRAKLKEIKRELRRRRHQPIPKRGRWLGQVVKGYFAYQCRPDQRTGSRYIPPSHPAPLGEVASATKPKGSLRMTEGTEACRRLAPQTEDPSPMASGPVCRQILEVGAQCGSAARWELSGGRGVTRVPTGILNSDHKSSSQPRYLRMSLSLPARFQSP